MNFALDTSEIERLHEAIAQFGNDARNAINEVFHNETLLPVSASIVAKIHPSGRTWAKKAVSATQTQPFRNENGNLSVTIKNKSKYQYLYFPDDGSNTRQHIGMQDFMVRGAEEVAPEIVDMCMDKIMKEW